MNPENENFDDLRRLLKLKRYEQPPPRYFNDFSSHIVSRLKDRPPEDRESFMETVGWQAPLLQRLFAAFEQKPFLAGMFGAAVCGLLVGGAVYSERMLTPKSEPGMAGLMTQTTPQPNGSSAFAAMPTSSTNPISIFDSIQPLSTQPVNYQPFGR